MPWVVFNENYRRAVIEIEASISDRVVAIVGGAILDDTLRVALSERLLNDKDITKKLLKVNGALGNTGPKIDLLYLLRAFGKSERNAFYGLAEVRNHLAHNLDDSLESKAPTLVEAMKKLTLHEGRAHYPHPLTAEDSEFEIEGVEDNRTKFIVNLKLGLIALMADRANHENWSNLPLTPERRKKRFRVESGRPQPSPGTPPQPQKAPKRNRVPSHKGRKPPPQSSKA